MPDDRVVGFDEQFYLQTYPDVQQAIANGTQSGALDHYLKFGMREGRLAQPVDAAFYLRTYPLAEAEIAAGKAADATAHFRGLGRWRGYLPAPDAWRPDFAAAIPSRFGGLWVDQPHALDLIEGKQEAGLVTAAQADLLRAFCTTGFVVLEGAVSPAVLARARAELDQAFTGAHPELLFECPTVAPEAIRWRPEILPFPAQALDLHARCPALQEAVSSPALCGFLALLFDSMPVAARTRGILRSAARPVHQDSARFAFSLPRSFVLGWIALEAAAEGSGELFFYPGSHRLPDQLFDDAFKSTAEAARLGSTPEALEEQAAAHRSRLEERIAARRLAKRSFPAKAGDVLIGHADLAHGCEPAAADATRRSLAVHYCPKYVVAG